MISTIQQPGRTIGKRQQSFENLYTCYLSGQFGEKSLQWHKKNKPGFAAYVDNRKGTS